MFKLFQSRDQKNTGPVDSIIVGLGNPGSKYENSRHNVGFLFMDRLAEKYGVKVNRVKFKGLTATAVIGGKKTLLLKPSTFMNLSGQSVTEAMRFYKLPPEKVLIVFDDISLPVGKIRIRRKGSDGGQNGMKNIIYLSAADTFPRIKIGVGAKPHPDYNLADWVLSSFNRQEYPALVKALTDSVEAAALINSGDIDRAMSQYN